MKLNTNYSKIKQPEGTNTFSLNVVTDLEHQGSDCNEIGNELCTQLDSTLVGQPVMLDRDRFVFLLKNNSVWVVNVTTCEATLHCQLDCFGWDTLDEELYPITGTHRIVRGCEDIVYLFNGIDRDRFINISRPEKQKTNGIFDCSKFDFDAEIVHPTINREILNSGGNLEYGTYNFSIEFLTSNKDSIFVSPVDINYTPIIYQQEGALNLATNLPDIGGKPLSNKSIKLTITNIPEDAILARIVVFRHITGDGFTGDAHVVGNLIPVNGSTLEYIYRGFNVSNGDYLVDKNEYLTPKAIYQSSLGGIQVNNRLLRYNLKETIRDYNNYQQKASKICTKYVVKEVDKNDPNIYLFNQTFLGGEIILPCIHWVHKDGSVSNAYPLIGRTKLPNDEVLVDDILNNGQEVEKWKYFDTSIKDATPITGYVSSGEFGYYESDQTYSDPPNYCGSNYWGFDCDGNNLEDSPVRLFVVPDRSVEPHDVDDTIRPIGIWFDETTIEFPNDDVVGYYFSTVVGQSNIQAKGIGFSASYFADGQTDPVQRLNSLYNPLSSGSENDSFYNFITDEVYLNNSYVTGELLGTEGYWNWSYDKLLEETNFNNVFEDDLPYDDLKITWVSSVGEGFNSKPYEVKKLDSSIIIPSRSTIDNISNVSMSNSFHIVTPENDFVWDAGNQGIKYLVVKNTGSYITNVWSITTRRITNLNEIVSFIGGYFLSPANIDNVATVSVIDTHIFGDEEISSLVETVLDFYIESKSNWFLRHTGTSPCNKHVQKEQSIVDLFFNKIVEPYKDKFKVKDSICPFFAGYNKDYSYIQELNRYSTIGFVFDFCSECTGLYPHRIIFSPQSFAEDLADGYRINRPNDYIDIPANTGSIVAVDYKDNKLVVRTERSCYFLQPNPQQMETSESNVYIGTGDFLSIPPQELNISQPGYGGQQHKLDSINTEKGLIWSDRRRGEMYLLGGEFKLISNDMEKWFIDELPKPIHLIYGYDPLHERLMVTSKDNWTLSYCFKEQGWKSWHSYIPDWYIYNASTFYSVLEDGLWEHNKGNYTTYYGLEFPHVVEMIIKSEGQTFLPQSVIYHANTYDLSNGYEQDVIGITYDQFLAYNDVQSTGFQNLILNDSGDIYWNPTSTHVKQTDRNYKISPLKDLATSSNIWTTDITSIKQGTQGYFKLLPVVDANKNMVDIGSFRSKWLGLWLISNQHQYKISLEFGDSNKQASIR